MKTTRTRMTMKNAMKGKKQIPRTCRCNKVAYCSECNDNLANRASRTYRRTRDTHIYSRECRYSTPIPKGAARIRCDAMRHQRFPGQTKYPNGETMCTTACVCMCIAILSGRLRRSRSFPSLVHEVMSTSGVIQGFLRSRYGLGLTSVHDVLRNGGMRRYLSVILFILLVQV